MDIAPPLASVGRAAPKAKTHRYRSYSSDAVYSLGAIAGIALPVGISATRFAQDALLGVTAAGMAALVLVALLNSLGVLGGR